jgi:hypothetical protein
VHRVKKQNSSASYSVPLLEMYLRQIIEIFCDSVLVFCEIIMIALLLLDYFLNETINLKCCLKLKSNL